jgi:uncharacterized membrane protein YozB (DUF420 family)
MSSNKKRVTVAWFFVLYTVVQYLEFIESYAYIGPYRTVQYNWSKLTHMSIRRIQTQLTYNCSS